eukprot:195929-Prorocentrum_minimum.AAC.1
METPSPTCTSASCSAAPFGDRRGTPEGAAAGVVREVREVREATSAGIKRSCDKNLSSSGPQGAVTQGKACSGPSLEGLVTCACP